MANSKINLLNNTLKKEKELVFHVNSSPYGRECYLNNSLGDAKLAQKLKDLVGFFDHTYHDKFDLELGHSRTYCFTLDKSLSLEISYNFEYSEGSKWGVELEDEIIKKIILILSEHLNCQDDDFEEMYYFSFKFSTKKSSQEKMQVFRWSDEKEIELKKTIFEKIKKVTNELSQKYGANTSEKHCEFDYELDSGSESFYINESWINTVESDEINEFFSD